MITDFFNKNNVRTKHLCSFKNMLVSYSKHKIHKMNLN